MSKPRSKSEIARGISHAPIEMRVNPYGVTESHDYLKQVRFQMFLRGISYLAAILSTIAIFYSSLVFCVNYVVYARNLTDGVISNYLVLMVLLIVCGFLGLTLSIVRWRMSRYPSSLIVFVLALGWLFFGPGILAIILTRR